jgi:hypothetical protein
MDQSDQQHRNGEEMSLYTELASKAVAWSKRFHDHHDACSAFANRIAGDYSVYIDAPQKNVRFIKLDGDLRSTNKVTPCTGPAPMTLGKDEFWYFGLSLFLEQEGSKYYMTENIAVGLQQGKDEWIVRWNDTDHHVPFGDFSKVRTLFDAWTAMSNDTFDGPVTRRANGIGFVPSE